jgi:hypothetical protein
VSSTGGEKGVKPQRYDLLPKGGLDAIAEVFAFGAEKYADHNWRRGYEWGKSYAALQRHLTAFWDGETHDPESGLPHLAHAGFHILVLLTWLRDERYHQFDDRWDQDKLAPKLPEPTLAKSWLADYDAEHPRTIEITFEAMNPLLHHILYGELRPARFVAGPHGTEDSDDSFRPLGFIESSSRWLD